MYFEEMVEEERDVESESAFAGWELSGWADLGRSVVELRGVRKVAVRWRKDCIGHPSQSSDCG